MKTPTESSWLIFADGSGLSDKLVSKLRAAGVRCRVARRGDDFLLDGKDAFRLRAEVLDDWKQLLRACTDDAPPERFVYLWSLDAERSNAEGEAELMGTDALLHLTQAVQNVQYATKLRIDLVTRGAQPPGQAMKAVTVAQSPLIGLLRVILNECPNFTGRGIDLPPIASASDASLLWNELLRQDSEREIAFRGEARYVQRLARGRSGGEEWLDPTVPLRLESSERGISTH